MFEFMHNVVTLFWFILIVIIVILGVVLVCIEIYDHITGADLKRQAELDRLRQLESERSEEWDR